MVLGLRRRWVVSLVVGSLLAVGGALAAERTMSAGSRRRSLEKLRTSTSAKDGGGAVVVVDDMKFDRYVTGVPRQYEAIVFFTAAQPQYKCSNCRAQLDEFTVLAESYQAAKANDLESLNEVDVYFFVADFSQNQMSFQNLGLQTVPKIIHFPSALAEGEEGRYAVNPSQFLQPGKPDAEVMARFVKEKTGVSFPVVRPEPPVMLILAGLLVLTLVAGKLVLSNLGAVLRFVRNKYMWLSISLMVYTFGISGGVYDIIRNPAPFMMKQDGSILWFHPQVVQSNVQLVVEGFTTGVMTLICGLSGILLVHVAPKLRSHRFQQVAVGAFSLGFVLLFVNVMKLYRMKNVWYRPVF